MRLLFGFQGRIPRSTYWTVKLSVAIVFALMAFFVVKAGHSPPGDRHAFEHGFRTLHPLAQVAFVAFCLLGAWILMATFVKRLHDLDMNGGPGMGFLYYRQCGWRRGTIGANRYGPDPPAPTTQRQT